MNVNSCRRRPVFALLSGNSARAGAAPYKVIFALAAAVAVATAYWLRTPSVVTGLVEGKSGPIPGARVRVQGSGRLVLSDSRGLFHLPAGDGTTITGWASGYYITGAAVPRSGLLRLQLKPIPAADNESYSWISPAPDPDNRLACANCHTKLYREWSASAHGRSAVNRRFLTMFYGTDWSGQRRAGWHFAADRPESRAVCTPCHLPTVTAFEPAAEDPAAARGVDREGVHCDFCHKVRSVEAAAIGLAHGRHAFELLRPPPGRQLFFGQLDDVTQDEAAFSALYRSSDYCAGCHEGVLFGIPVYTTWSEWRDSTYAARGVHCQDCHMKPDGRTSRVAPGHGGVDRDPWTISTHRMAAADDPELLRRSVQMTCQASRRANSIHVSITLQTTGVGHRMPTGSPLRHLILTVKASGPDGPLELIKGPRLPAAAGLLKAGSTATGHRTGQNAGMQNGASDRKTGRDISHAVAAGCARPVSGGAHSVQSPDGEGQDGMSTSAASVVRPGARDDGHSELITPWPRDLAGLPGKLYAKLLIGPDGTVPVPFWRSVGILQDTRLEPDKPDRVRFVFRSQPGPVTVTVRLIYRRSFLAVAVAKQWPDKDITLAEQQLTLP